MTDRKTPQNAPHPIQIEAGKTYYWCTCGKSAAQPFCDGSHKGSGLKSMAYNATETKTVFFCGCKHSKHPPFCDGSHGKSD